MSEWQDISTAPKDGTSILVARIDDDVGTDAIEINHWYVRENWRFEPIGGDLYRKVALPPYTGWSGNGHRATHWMPLPTPPTTGEPGK